jgi:hypothetical protein
MPKDKKKRRPHFTARNADRYTLYGLSVQEPSHEVVFFDQIYREAFGKTPRVLREDFCGTFAVCCAWAQKRGRVAIGVDLDPEPLAWGREHNLGRLTATQQKNVRLIQDDVRSVSRPKADILAAQNFSFWVFKQRHEVIDYFRHAHRNLNKQGLMVLDMMGGSECYVVGHRDFRKIGKGRKQFTYVWEQHSYNPINHDASFYIHFHFQDGSKLKRAFEYHWRFWTIPEVREMLAEAGFSRTHVYWEGVDAAGEGDNDWKRSEQGAADASWLAYIVAEK